MISGPAGFHTIASYLMEAVRDALAASENGPMKRACVVPGVIAWDECECGMLAVAVARWYLSDSFPDEAGPTMPGCGAAWRVAEYVLQPARCAPGPASETVLSPTCAALEASARAVAVDASVTLSTVACLLHEMKRAGDIVDYQMLTQLPSGPSGQCVGSELRVLVGITNTA